MRRSVLIGLSILVTGLCAVLVWQALKPERTLVGIVSARNSAAAASAAARFTDTYPDDRVILRTPEQIRTMSDASLEATLREADAVLIAGVFGEDAMRVARLASELPEGRPIAAISVASTLSQLMLNRMARIDGEEASTRFRDRVEAYWQGRGTENLANLFAYVLSDDSARDAIAVPQPIAPIRFGKRKGVNDAPLMAIIDYETGDQIGNRDLHTALCEAAFARQLACQSIYADWGAPTAEAIEQLHSRKPAAVISLADFALGGPDRERANEALAQLDVPVVKGIRLDDMTEEEWRASGEGLPTDSVYYRVAMPELSGASQPVVLAAATPPRIDQISGIEISVTEPIVEEVNNLAARLANWAQLRTKPNAEKRVAIIYYNHPPGRHNIGADNLDVPASLLAMLRRMKADGYQTGPLPASSDALMDMMQARGVNLPGDPDALRAMNENSPLHLSIEKYRGFFRTLPDVVREEMTGGPLAALQARVRIALERHDPEAALADVDQVLRDLEFVIEGTPGERGAKARGIVARLHDAFGRYIGKGADGAGNSQSVSALIEKLRALKIEGVEGWGASPGKVMTVDGRFVFPGIRFGNVFIGPQPPRGWETNEELLHANRSVPPPHQYLAFYHALRTQFGPDALVHLGRHSTYEFLPGPRTGLSYTAYSRLIAGDVPGIYPYIVDGVGEGLQAKRRGLAVMVDHLTPALATTPIYDDLLGLRQLVESYEGADPSRSGDAARSRALDRIRDTVLSLGMDRAIVAEIRHERGGGNVVFDELDPELLVHETGHLLTEMQEDFMPMGLHVFGTDWSDQAIATMVKSMDKPLAEAALRASPASEMAAFMAALDGRFVKPGIGNDPLRSPGVLPTGRNFYGIDASLVPDRIAWDLGVTMAKEPAATDGGRAVVLWASDTVRDGGVMIALGLSLLHIHPEWNSRGILTGLKRMPVSGQAPREDVTFVASGLFRDLYGEQLKWLDKAALIALDGASLTIRKLYPDLSEPLDLALAPLGELRDPGDESLADNRLAAAWVRQMQENVTPKPEDGRTASLRVFAPASGQYGAGINRLAERSGAWSDRDELARIYRGRVGHAYGVDKDGEPAAATFRVRLANIDQTFLGRASNLYGLVDNNDAFDYLGGLNMAAEAASGSKPDAFVVDVSNPDRPDMAPLQSALLTELRARQLNPAWIVSLMPHGYAGARTMNFAFFENLWGWEVTDPELFPDAVWDDVYDIYVRDRHNIGVDDFLNENDNLPIKANMLAVMLVAAQKGYWKADDDIVEDLAGQFVAAVNEVGLPGSGHTSSDHPMLDWIGNKLSPEQEEALQDARTAARGTPSDVSASQGEASMREVRPVDEAPVMETVGRMLAIALVAFVVLLLIIGFIRSRRSRT
ncbi:cobaltochelatase subunit CobN [Croceicoccus hydrothermalis]|uniref:cobaltochelatase subunit CobN n=1 Tax=Croceicoccus hydrothermalis TaxID=2867964 RepID=UPI001EFA9AFB|nr:cobaltochelatase subunit CobN [Croceicoccus hydrothermalis]